MARLDGETMLEWMEREDRERLYVAWEVAEELRRLRLDEESEMERDLR